MNGALCRNAQQQKRSRPDYMRNPSPLTMILEGVASLLLASTIVTYHRVCRRSRACMDTVALVLRIAHSTVFTEFALSIERKWCAGPLRIKVTLIAGFKPCPWREASRLLTRSQSFKTERTTYGIIRSASWPNFCESLGLPLPWMPGINLDF